MYKVACRHKYVKLARTRNRRSPIGPPASVLHRLARNMRELELESSITLHAPPSEVSDSECTAVSGASASIHG